MSGYLAGVLSVLCINIVVAYGVLLPVSTGQLNLGGAGFMAVGAYMSATLATAFGWSPAISIPLGALAGGIIGFLIAFPILRTRGVYMVLATFAFGEVVSGLILNNPGLGGAMGMSVPGYIDIKVILPVTLGVLLVVAFVMNSRIGLEMRAIHDDETVSDLLGVEVRYVQVFAFTLGGIVAGLAGGLYAHHFGFIEVHSFNSLLSIYVLLYVLFGGTQTTWGPLVGALFFTLLPEVLRAGLPALVTGAGKVIGIASTGQVRIDDGWRFVVLGTAIVLMMIWRPEGMVTRNMIERFRSKAKAPVQAEAKA